VNVKVIAALAAGLLSAAPAFSAPVVLDFEGTAALPSIANYYGGGAGPNYGVLFGDDLLGFQPDVVDPQFSNIPSGNTIMSLAGTGGASWMNVAAGFSGTASFFYSSAEGATVSIYSGLNGSGDVLGTFDLLANAQLGCTDTAFCHWDQISLDFGGVAQSIQFGNALGTGFDNVSVAPVPLPAAIWLLGSSLIGLGGVARRRKLKA
jgi:hypothetical protein